MRAGLALAFGLAALPGAGWLWHALPSEPIAAAVFVLVAAGVGAWLGMPRRAVEGGMHGVGVALAAAVAARITMVLLARPTTYAADVWPERLVALAVAAGVTLVLSVAAGMALAARRRAYENQPETTRTS